MGLQGEVIADLREKENGGDGKNMKLAFSAGVKVNGRRKRNR